MKQYLDMCQYILENGQDRDDRTGTGTRSVFGYQTRYDLTDGFPLLTTKKMFLRPIAEELLWFIKGDTNIKYLVDRNVKIWNEWPYEAFKKSEDFHGETLEEFVAKIKELPADDPFVVKYGELGPVYGRQWRNFNNEGIDQVAKLVDSLKNNPFSRRHIICAWNPAEVDEMALPPCHAFLQFYVSNDKKYLSCQLYQRSADTFLGVPFKNSRKFDTAISINLFLDSFGAQEMCGVIRQFFAVSSGLSLLMGSVDTTSRPAAATLPLFRASARSCSLIS